MRNFKVTYKLIIGGESVMGGMFPYSLAVPLDVDEEALCAVTADEVLRTIDSIESYPPEARIEIRISDFDLGGIPVASFAVDGAGCPV